MGINFFIHWSGRHNLGLGSHFQQNYQPGGPPGSISSGSLDRVYKGMCLFICSRYCSENKSKLKKQSLRYWVRSYRSAAKGIEMSNNNETLYVWVCSHSSVLFRLRCFSSLRSAFAFVQKLIHFMRSIFFWKERIWKYSLKRERHTLK